MAAKILGQRTGAGAQADLYTVPPGGEAVCSTFIAVNTAATAATLRVSIAQGGAPDTLAHRCVHDLPLGAGQRLAITEGWTLAAGDVVRATAPEAVALHLFGSEITS